MEVMSGRPASVLNPDAPLFVPMAYRAVEDFSDEWWDLVKSTAWFRDYWLRECFSEEPVAVDDDQESALPEIEEIFECYKPREEDEEKGQGRELALWGAEKWRGMRLQQKMSTYAEKVPKIVKTKLSPRPRTIQQPR